MRNSIRKSLFIFSVAFLTCGCRNNRPTSSTGISSLSSEISSSSGHKPSYSTEISMWTGFETDYTAEIESVVNKYNEDKTGLVHVTNTCVGNCNKLEVMILNSIGSRTFPNIANGYPDHFAEYWKKDIINPLDDYIARYNQEHGINLIDDYYSQYMIENQQIGYDDDGRAFTLGLPFSESTEVMLCNGYYFDFFKEHDPSITVPRTWDDLLALAPKLRTVVEALHLEDAENKYIIGTVGADGHATGTRVSSTNDSSGSEQVLQEIDKLNCEKPFYALGYDNPDNAFITILHQWNIPYTSYSYEDYKNNYQYGKALFWQDANKAATRTALQYFVDLNLAKGFGVPNTFHEMLSCTAALEQGRCLFTIGSSGGLSKPDFNGKRLDIYPILCKDAAHKAVISQGTSLCLLNQYTSPETYEKEMYQAFSTMVELTTGELQAKWVTSTGYFPSSQSAYSNPQYQALLSTDNPTRIETLYRDAGRVNNDIYDAQGWNKFVDPGFCDSDSIRVATAYILQKITTGTSIDEAMNDAWARIDANVK